MVLALTCYCRCGLLIENIHRRRNTVQPPYTRHYGQIDGHCELQTLEGTTQCEGPCEPLDALAFDRGLVGPTAQL